MSEEEKVKEFGELTLNLSEPYLGTTRGTSENYAKSLLWFDKSEAQHAKVEPPKGVTLGKLLYRYKTILEKLEDRLEHTKVVGKTEGTGEKTEGGFPKRRVTAVWLVKKKAQKKE